MAKFFVGPYETGIQRNMESWLLPNEAFVDLENCYVWRQRVVRKNGYEFLGRLNVPGTTALPIALGNVNAGDTTFTIAGAAWAAVGDLPISPGSLRITIGLSASAPDPGVDVIMVDNGDGTLNGTPNAATLLVYAIGTIDYQSGDITLQFTAIPGSPPYTALVAFPVTITALGVPANLPVVGLPLRESPTINIEDLLAFDTSHSYIYNTVTNVFDMLAIGTFGANNQYASNDYDFIWAWNYYTDNNSNILTWAVNGTVNNAGHQNGIQFFNGTTWWTIQPLTIAGNYLRGCLMMVSYRNRLVALNTIEGLAMPGATVEHRQRARWSQNGNPVPNVDSAGGAIAFGNANAWTETTGYGGYIDAPTAEAIVSCGFYKDTLIVFFERSTWELRYTGNEILPFVWYRINSELGAESTFASVVFDKGIMAVGDKRIIIANPADVVPIDQKIPDEVYNFHNENQGQERVHGIRDFYRKLVYWTFPNDDNNGTYPNRMLVLNYEEQTYSFFKNSFTCFGRYQSRSDLNWSTNLEKWALYPETWENATQQAYFPDIVAGNQRGFVVVLDKTVTNDKALDATVSLVTGTISNTNPPLINCPNHNMADGDFVKIFNIIGFVVAVAAEDLGTIEAGQTEHTATLANLGVIPGSIVITAGAITIIDLGAGNLQSTTATGGVADATGTIDYETGIIVLRFRVAFVAATPITANYNYNILNHRIFRIDNVTTNTFTIEGVAPNGDPVSVDLSGFPAPYAGQCDIEKVENFYIMTKIFTPFIKDGKAMDLMYYDLFLTKSSMEFESKVFLNENNNEPTETYVVSCDQEGENRYPTDKLWKRVYASIYAQYIQLEFEMTDYQMTQFSNYASPFELHAMIWDLEPAGRMVET